MPRSWNDAKNRENKRKHGLSFETAQLVFNDPHALSRPDSVHERRRPMKGGLMKKVIPSRLNVRQRAELEALAALPDDRIDTTDVPEVNDWSDAKQGLFYRPVKKQLTLRIDADVVAWFKSRAPKGQGYQTQMNMALRDHVRRHARPRKAS
jgi:uncharacterized protein (DUF4415 family)